VRRYRFGVFEADAAAGELRRQGLRVKLGLQAFQVLVMLLERPGELVTREEISRRLWPDGTFVDYEQGVNSAVNRVREALGDTASSPRFVETLARRGYRFVAPVEVVGGGAAAMEAAEEAGLEDDFGGGILASPQDLAKVSPATVRTMLVLLQVMYVAFYVGALANLAEIDELMAELPHAGAVFMGMIVTAAVMIPVRAFVVSAVALRPPGARGKLLKLWWLMLPMDLVWALSPFLLLHHISVGLAMACTALLVYSPFAQRSLVLMGAADRG
jgi:cholera toxin transcriptional activator